MAREDLGLVWMGDMLLQSDPLIMDHQADTPFFTESPHSYDDLRARTVMQQYTQDMDGFMILDELEDPYCEEDMGANKFMTSAATQTPVQQTGSRKIKPVKHPGLKLQTPIAYQRDTDLSVIPIKPDGMARCEKCGAIGVKHAFYTRERRFCSMACARGSTEIENSWSDSHQSPPQQTQIPNYNTLHQQLASNVKLDMDRKLEIPPLPPPLPPLKEEEFPFVPDQRLIADLEDTYDWSRQISEKGFVAAPVSLFKHAPMSDNWDNITVGMKVEVENTDCDNFSEDFPDSFWVATVLQIAGYKALLRYEGFGQNSAKDFWVNLCSSIVHPVGWCATRGKPLIPPKTIEDKYKDWKEFLVKRLTGARTLPSNFYSKVHDSLKSRFRCDLNLEVVDKNRISQVKVATIKRIVGKRLNITYYDSDPDDPGFWCHEDSPLIHPVGWARRIGQTIDAPPNYVDRCFKGLRDKDDATEDLFPKQNLPPVHSSGLNFQEGMKLEAVDPLNLSSICVATVMKVLNEGYIMIRIDSYDDEETSCNNWFCYHTTSPVIFTPGFCSHNNISLTPPKGYDASLFVWRDYLAATNSVPAPPALFERAIPAHGFVVGMRLESADLMTPRLVCVGTVARVVGRLLKIHFDGWGDEYDQWLDCESPDMYPVGWCQLVGHKLEAPHSPVKNGTHPGGRMTVKIGVRKRRRRVPRKTGPNTGGKTQTQENQAVDEDGSIQMSDTGNDVLTPVQAETPITSLEWIEREPAQAAVLTGDAGQGSSCEMTGLNERSGSPEMGQEPAGPDQSLPVASEPSVPTPPPPPLPSSEKTPTSYVSNCNSTSNKVIPRLVDPNSPCETRDLVPDQWSVFDVAQFLRVNECAAYCESFSSKKIDGKAMLTLTKDQIVDLTGKVGPSVKIYDLIQQLKIKVNPAQERMKAGLKKLL